MKLYENKHVNIDHHEYDQIQKILHSKHLSGVSPTVVEYERKLADYFRTKHALAVTNGTTAIEIALRAVGVEVGDEVITTPLGPVMTPLPILALGAVPVFVDCQSTNSFNISLEDLKRKVTAKTKAVISVPMWGYPNDMNEIMVFCRDNGIILIEDVSHCHGTLFNEQYQGTFGDIAVFSTQERKLIGTGEGGFILTDNDYLSARIQELRNFGKPIRQNLLDLGLKDQYGHMFGLNYRLNAFAAAMGIAQIDKLKQKIFEREKNASYYRTFIVSQSLKELEIIEKGRPNYYSIVYKVNHPNLTAAQIGEKLGAFGIVSDTYRFKYQVLYQMPLFEPFASRCPNAENLSKSIITLPTHEGLNEVDLQFIVSKVNEIVSSD